MPTLAPLQFPINSLSDEVGSLFPLVQRGIDPSQGACRESSGGLLVIYLFPAHFVDITY